MTALNFLSLTAKFALYSPQCFSHRERDSGVYPKFWPTNYAKFRGGPGMVAVHVSNSLSSEIKPPKPTIKLEFMGLKWVAIFFHYIGALGVYSIWPKPNPDGTCPVQTASALSGEKLLRNIMLDNKIELYAAYGKVMNCGGGGSCGTCIVEVIHGKELLNERTATEQRYLKKKPDSWRLACQTIVGNKENSGKVVIQRLPQWKK